MHFNSTNKTTKKVEELQKIIVDQEGKPISKSKLFKILVDIAYEKLIKGETNE